MTRTLYKTYFSHDIYARQDSKIKKLLLHFRKESEDKARSALCLYWWIVEDMHADDFKISDLEVYADDYRCSAELLKSILEDFDLFRIENGCYISDRVLRNVEEMQEKAEKAKRAAAKRWNGNGNNDKPKQDEKKINIDDVYISEITSAFAQNFPSVKKISKDNKERIAKISEENELKIEDWQKIFKNASRGQDFNGKIQKIALKTILEKWDDILNNNYYLAEDKVAKQKKKQKADEQKEKERKELEEISLQELKKQQDEKANIKTVEQALEYLNKYSRLKTPEGLAHYAEYKELKNVYPIGIDIETKQYITLEQ